MTENFSNTTRSYRARARSRLAITSALAFLLITTAAANLSAQAAEPGAPPIWFLEEIETLCADGGRWIADNSKYRSEQERTEAYGIEWTSSFDGTSMTGRLFGIQGGKEVAVFWEFRQYWHPGEKHAVLEQFGWRGVYGAGRMWREGSETRSDQTFFQPDGGSARTGHVSSFPDRKTQITASFDIQGEEWKPQRTYTWRLTGSGS